MDDGYDRFADNDVFNMDLDQIKSVGHSLVAIQSRVNETVSKFNESMGDSDGLGDLRIIINIYIELLIMYFSKKKQLYKQTKDHLIHKCFLFIYLVYDYMIYFYSLHYSNYYMIHKCIKFVTISDALISV